MTVGASVLLIALGAMLLFAVTASVASLKVVVGVVLIVAGAVELLIALVTGRPGEPI